MPSLRSSVRATRSKSDMQIQKKKLVNLFGSSSRKRKRLNKKESLRNAKKVNYVESDSPSLNTSRSILSNSLSNLSNSSGSPEIDSRQLILRRKSINLESTSKSVFNTSISSRQNVQQNCAQAFTNQSNQLNNTPELKLVKNAHQTLSLKNKTSNTSSSENFSNLKMSVLTEMGYKPNQFLNQEQFNRNLHNKWLQFGQFVRFKPLYESAYLEPLNSASVIYVCEFCLTHFLSLDLFKTHIKSCSVRFPPGNEIYRDVDEGLCIWEVEGGFEATYCRNLCLMAKLFMSSKTLYHEVDTFTFYVLTEISSRGCVTVAYFSKEKNPSKNNNLSCLLTLPHAQGKGYGKLLIDLSYQFSKLEHKIGSPEHPLSDMGLLAYRSYWRSVLFSVLRQLKNTQTISIKDLSIETAIHSSDILSTLLFNDMLRSRHDTFYIDIDKALSASSDSLQRRSINVNLLKWLPPFEPIPHCKMNSYVSSN